jgi:hypothetical protein
VQRRPGLGIYASKTRCRKVPRIARLHLQRVECGEQYHIIAEIVFAGSDLTGSDLLGKSRSASICFPSDILTGRIVQRARCTVSRILPGLRAYRWARPQEPCPLHFSPLSWPPSNHKSPNSRARGSHPEPHLDIDLASKQPSQTTTSRRPPIAPPADQPPPSLKQILPLRHLLWLFLCILPRSLCIANWN